MSFNASCAPYVDLDKSENFQRDLLFMVNCHCLHNYVLYSIKEEDDGTLYVLRYLTNLG